MINKLVNYYLKIVFYIDEIDIQSTIHIVPIYSHIIATLTPGSQMAYMLNLVW